MSQACLSATAADFVGIYARDQRLGSGFKRGGFTGSNTQECLRSGARDTKARASSALCTPMATSTPSTTSAGMV